VSYEEVVSHIVDVVEAAGALIMVAGALIAFVGYGMATARPASRPKAYRQLRRTLSRAILLGLEVLIVGDIVRTIIVDSTITSVAVLGMIVAIRIVLSFSLEVEMDGTWPWSRWRVEESKATSDR